MVNELDRWMWDYAHPPEQPRLDADTTPDEVEVYGSYALSQALWLAWRDHGVMPVAGGYLDQPRKWRAMIDLFNQRHYRATYGDGSSELDLSSFRVDTGEASRGFDGFMRRG